VKKVKAKNIDYFAGSHLCRVLRRIFEPKTEE
jgi:hypothetical protein